MPMKLQIFTIKNSYFRYYYTCLAVISLDSSLKKDDSYYPQVFSKECKYIEKKVFRYIHDSLSDFFEPDEE